MVEKGNLTVFESNSISETGETTPLKLVHMYTSSIPTWQVGIDEVYMCTNFSGVVSPVSEILLLSKAAKFPFSTMDYI